MSRTHRLQFIWLLLLASYIEWKADVDWSVANDYIDAGKQARYKQAEVNKNKFESSTGGLFDVQFGNIDFAKGNNTEEYFLKEMPQSRIVVTNGKTEKRFGARIINESLVEYLVNYEILYHHPLNQQPQIFASSEVWQITPLKKPPDTIFLYEQNKIFQAGNYEFVVYINGERVRNFPFSVKEYCETHVLECLQMQPAKEV